MKFGVVQSHKKNYSLSDRLHLLSMLKKFKGNIYTFNALSWKSAYKKPKPNIEKTIDQLVKNAGKTEIWIGMKPGDRRYCMHKRDQNAFIDVANYILDRGVDGIYIPMDDTHPHNQARVKDARYQSELINRLYDQIGTKIKGVCGERYHGNMLKDVYWKALDIPLTIPITWTGPGVWTGKLNRSFYCERPVIFWDNFFANDSSRRERAPAYAYNYRNPKAIKEFDYVLVKPNKEYRWQIGPMYTVLTA